MRHFLLPGSCRPGQLVELSGDDHHYLTRVLRLGSGSRVRAIDADGCAWTLSIEATDVTSLRVRVEPPDESIGSMAGTARSMAGTARARRLASITLYQALPKGRKMDDVVRDATQAGAHTIVPIITGRTIVRPEENVAGRVERWNRIAREAVQQSGADAPVTVTPPVRLELIELTPGLNLVLHTEPLAQTTLHGYLGEVPERIGLLVGPEGGFSDGEIEFLRNAGAQPLWLGPQVYRTELAALAALAALRMLVLERAQWQLTE